MKRIDHLQSLRGLAALMVVWAHAIDLTSRRGLASWQGSFAYFENIGAAGVDIFFVISGFIVYLAAGRGTPPGQFLARRLIRVWPLYAVATLLMFLLQPFETLGSGRLWEGLLLLQTAGAPRSLPVHPLGWSLMFEMCFYLMLAGALCWRWPRPVPLRMAIILAVALGAGAVAGYPQPLNIVGNPVIVEFGFGILIGHLWRTHPQLAPRSVRLLWAAGGLALLFSAMLGYGDIDNARSTMDASASWRRVASWGIPAALLVAATVYAAPAQRSGGLAVFLGDASYSIYLFSYPVLVLIDRYWPAIASGHPDLVIVGATALAGAVGCLAYRVLERPLLRSMQARFLAPPGAAEVAGATAGTEAASR